MLHEVAVKRIWISVQSPFERDMLDLEVPAEKPLQALLPDLIRAMNWPDTRDGQKLYYALATEDGQPIDPDETLLSAGLRPRSIVRVLVATRPFIPAASGSLSKRRPLGSPGASSAGDRRDPRGASASGQERATEPPDAGRSVQGPSGWRKLEDSDS